MTFTHQNIHSKPTKKVGFVVKTHGFNGDVRVNFTEFPVIDKKYILLLFNNKFVPFKIISQKNNYEILNLETINNFDEASELIGKELVIFDDKNTNDAINWEEFSLIDSKTLNKYQITKIIENPGNDLIEFRVNFKDCLIPFIDELIVNINEENKEITMDFPEGILDL